MAGGGGGWVCVWGGGCVCVSFLCLIFIVINTAVIIYSFSRERSSSVLHIQEDT